MLETSLKNNEQKNSEISNRSDRVGVIAWFVFAALILLWLTKDSIENAAEIALIAIPACLALFCFVSHKAFGKSTTATVILLGAYLFYNKDLKMTDCSIIVSLIVGYFASVLSIESSVRKY